MRPTFLLLLLVALSCAFPATLCTVPGSGQGTADSGQRAEEDLISAPCTLHPAPSSSGRGIVFDFDLLTENTQVEANVSDPAAVSVSLVLVVRNNATAPLSVRLSASINLGGKVKLDPAQTPLLLYQATANVIVSVTLPEDTSSDSMGYLQIEGICDQNPTVTNQLQIRVTIKQWHRVTIERFSLSTTSPLEREMVQINARVLNAGNGPSFFAASAMVDGKPLRLKVDGYPAPANHTVSIAAGRYFLLAASWPAAYGHHNFALEVRDVGKTGVANTTEFMSKDTRVASVFVGFNYRDLIPFAYVTIIVLVAAALIGYRFRRKLVPRLRRLGRRLRRLPPEEGDVEYEEDEGYEDDEYEDDEEYEDEENDDGEYEDEGEGDDEGEDEGEAPPKRPAAVLPKKAAAPVKRPLAPKAPLTKGKPAAKGAARPAAKPPTGSAARPAPKPGVILVGGPLERPAPKGRAGGTPVEMVEEE